MSKTFESQIGNIQGLNLNRPFAGIDNDYDTKTAQFIEKFRELIEKHQASQVGGQFALYPVEDKRLLYSVATLVEKVVVDGTDCYFYATLVLAFANRRGRPVTDVAWPENRAVSTLPLTPDDVYHSDQTKVYLKEIVIAEIKKQTNYTDIKQLTDCGEFVVLDIPDQTEKLSPGQFESGWLRILSNATYSTFINVLKGLGKLSNPNDYYFGVKGLIGKPTVTIVYNGKPEIGPSGEEIRKDISVILSNTQVNQNTSTFLANTTTEIVQVSGYIDTAWRPTSQATVGGNRYLTQYGNQVQGPITYEPPYTALAIMTHFQNKSSENIPPTLEVMLSGILAFSVLQDSAIWQRTYDPNYIGEKTPYNVAAAAQESGLPINPGDEIDFHDFINAAWQQTPAFAIDVERNGSNFWALKPFTTGGKGTKEIMSACDNFFGRNFSEYFDVTRQPIVVSKMVLQGGYYATGKELRDIREIDDYIYAMNALGTEPDTRPADRQDFDDLFDSLNPDWRGYTQQQRLAVRYRILNSIANNSFIPTTTIERVILNPAFIAALTNAAIDCGITLDIEGRRVVDGQNARRGLNLSNYATHTDRNIFTNTVNRNYPY